MARTIKFTGVTVTVRSADVQTSDDVAAAITNLAIGQEIRVGGWYGERWTIDGVDFSQADAVTDNGTVTDAPAPATQD